MNQLRRKGTSRQARNPILPQWAVTDLLIDGPFQIEHLDISRPWVGSSNQRYHFLTDRYLHLKERLNEIPNRLEVRLKPDGRVLVNGLAETKVLEDLFKGLL